MAPYSDPEKELAIERAENDLGDALIEAREIEAETWRRAHQQLATAIEKGH